MVAGYSELIGAEQFLVAEVRFELISFTLGRYCISDSITTKS
jgi:hypothetical protein